MVKRSKPKTQQPLISFEKFQEIMTQVRDERLKDVRDVSDAEFAKLTQENYVLASHMSAELEGFLSNVVPPTSTAKAPSEGHLEVRNPVVIEVAAVVVGVAVGEAVGSIVHRKVQ